MRGSPPTVFLLYSPSFPRSALCSVPFIQYFNLGESAGFKFRRISAQLLHFGKTHMHRLLITKAVTNSFGTWSKQQHEICPVLSPSHSLSLPPTPCPDSLAISSNDICSGNRNIFIHRSNSRLAVHVTGPKVTFARNKCSTEFSGRDGARLEKWEPGQGTQLNKASFTHQPCLVLLPVLSPHFPPNSPAGLLRPLNFSTLGKAPVTSLVAAVLDTARCASGLWMLG